MSGQERYSPQSAEAIVGAVCSELGLAERLTAAASGLGIGVRDLEA